MTKTIDTTKPIRIVGTDELVTFRRMASNSIVVSLPTRGETNIHRWFKLDGTRDVSQSSLHHDVALENVPEAGQIDVTKPLEAVRKSDGKVVPVTFVKMDPYNKGEFWTTPCPDPTDTNDQWYLTGEDRCSDKAWIIRNVAQTGLIDTAKPLEAVEHATGRVVPMIFDRLDSYNPTKFFWTQDSPCNSTSNTAWHMDGTDRCGLKKWIIRNIAEVVAQPAFVDTTKPMRVAGTHEPVTFVKSSTNGTPGFCVKLPVSTDPAQIDRWFTCEGERHPTRSSSNILTHIRVENVPATSAGGPLDLTRPMQMRDGTKVTLLSSNATGDNPLVFQTDGTDIIFARPLHGRALPDQDLPIDIINLNIERSDFFTISPTSMNIAPASGPGGALTHGIRLEVKRVNGKVVDVVFIKAGPDA